MWENFVKWLNTAWEFLNKPLPIVGVSTLIICLFILKFISSTSFGKKNIKRLNDGFNRISTACLESQAEIKKFEDKFNKALQEKDEEIAHLKEIIKKICDNIPNKKIKKIGEEVYGEETTNSDTETKEI